MISGHTHSAYNCKLPNAAGRTVSVTSASSFGRVLTDVDVVIDPATKDITQTTATNRLVARNDASVKADANVAKIVDGYKALVSPVAGAVIGSTEVIVDAAGVVLSPTKTFRVTVNNFMADGGDGYSTLKKGTNRLGGAQDIDALMAYMSQFKAPRSPYNVGTVAEDAGTPRINRAGGSTTCPTVANVDP